MDKVNIDNYISLEETKEYLGMKAPTLRNWFKNSKIEVPAHKVGRLC